MTCERVSIAAIPVFLMLSAHSAFAAAPPATSPSVLAAPEVSAAPPPNERAFNLAPEHQFTWAGTDAKRVQVGVNFGLLQLALGGFNIAGEVRYRRLWLEYSHGVGLTLNDAGGFGLSPAERRQNLHVFVPYTTGFGVGVTLVDELWLGVELKSHRYEVNAPGGSAASYQTYSVGPVLGYKAFIWKGLYANGYLRYWPNVGSTLTHNQIALQGDAGTITHNAHDFGVFANAALGYAFDL